jgi:hypothetical protein
MDAASLDGVDAVVCSALLDLTSRQWMERLFAALRTPFYASLTVDGRDAWFPRHPADLAVRLAFRCDQRREKGFGFALGVDAARVEWVHHRARVLDGCASLGHVPKATITCTHVQFSAITADAGNPRFQRSRSLGVPDKVLA